MKLSTLSVLAVSALSLAAASVAQAVVLDRYNSDTRYNSTATPDSFASPGDTNPGSLKYATGNDPGTGPDGRNKVAVTFYQADASGTGTPAGAVLGTLGSLNQLSLDYYVAGSSGILPAVRLKLSPNGTPSTSYVDLVWEPAYNGGGASNAWNNDVSVLGGSFWQRSNGVNHDGDNTATGGNNGFQPLSAWVGGFVPQYNGPGVALNANTPIYGLEVSMGSGLPNGFTGYIDDVRIGFAGGQSYTANIAVPEPTTLAALGAASAMGLRRRRRA